MKIAAAWFSQSVSRQLDEIRPGIVGTRSVAEPYSKRSLAGGTWQWRVDFPGAWILTAAAREMALALWASSYGMPTQSRRCLGLIVDGTNLTCPEKPQKLTHSRTTDGCHWGCEASLGSRGPAIAFWRQNSSQARLSKVDGKIRTDVARDIFACIGKSRISQTPEDTKASLES